MRRLSIIPLLATGLLLALGAMLPAQDLYVRKAAGQGYWVGEKHGQTLEMQEAVGPVGTETRGGRLLYVWEGVSSSQRYYTPLPPGMAPAGDPLAQENPVDMLGAAWSNGLAALGTMDVPVVDPDTWSAGSSEADGRVTLRVVVLSREEVVDSPRDVTPLDWAEHLTEEGIEESFFRENARHWRIVEITNFPSAPGIWTFAETPEAERRELSFFEYGMGSGSIWGDVNIGDALEGDEFSTSIFGNGSTYALDLSLLSAEQREYVEASWFGRFASRVGYAVDGWFGGDDAEVPTEGEGGEPAPGGSAFGQSD